MKITEKILVGLITVQALFLVISGFDGYGSVVFFYCLLGLFYLFGSYWLFRPRGVWQIVLSLFAGFALACGFLALYYFSRIIYTPQVYLFAAPNAILALGTGMFLTAAKIRKTESRFGISVFTRSVVILLVTSVFAFTPVTVKAFRKVLIGFNKHDFERYNNLLMFDFGEKFEEAYEAGDCEQAIKFALESNKAAKRWLLMPATENLLPELHQLITDSLQLKSKQSDCSRIGQTYQNVYSAYVCRANKEYEDQNYAQALESFRAGHFYLTDCFIDSPKERKELSWSFYNMAVCLRKLEKFEMADAMFIAAYKNYLPVKDWAGLAEYIGNYGKVLGKEMRFEDANYYLKTANAYLQKDSLTPATKASLAINYLELTKNHIHQDSTAAAMEAVKKAFTFLPQERNKQCKANLYYAMCFYKLNKFEQADSAAQISLGCFKTKPGTDSQNIAEAHLLLGYIQIARAQYTQAEKHLNSGMQITEKNYGANHTRYANCLRAFAELKQATGNYTQAEALYKKAIAIYNNDADAESVKAEALSGLAFTELTLSSFEPANAHSDTALAIINRLFSTQSTGISSVLNIAANVDYFLGNYTQAAQLHERVLDVNRKSGLKTEPEIATALNGLGLIETERKRYAKADFLFTESVRINKAVLTENHPLTANAYLNHSGLMIRQNRLTEAEQTLAKAEQVYKNFFNPDHDCFGDILMAKGELASRRKEPETALNLYKKALAIYQKKFSNQHWKVLHAMEKSASEVQ